MEDHVYFDAQKILDDNKATMHLTEDKDAGVWSLDWKHGVIGWIHPEWSEEQATRAGAMFIYLWKNGIDAGYASSLASLWANHITMERI